MLGRSFVVGACVVVLGGAACSRHRSATPAVTPDAQVDAVATDLEPDAADDPADDGTDDVVDDGTPGAGSWNTPAPPRRRRSLHVTLRSTPTGALVAIDGRPVGETPVVGDVPDDNRPHEFTFSLPNYAMTRYKLRVVQSGVVHGRLNRLPSPDAAPE